MIGVHKEVHQRLVSNVYLPLRQCLPEMAVSSFLRRLGHLDQVLTMLVSFLRERLQTLLSGSAQVHPTAADSRHLPRDVIDLVLQRSYLSSTILRLSLPDFFMDLAQTEFVTVVLDAFGKG